MSDERSDALSPTARTDLRRKKERGSHRRQEIFGILDEALICHVGFDDDGTTCVLPSTFVRIGDLLYLHGAVGNRMLQVAASGDEICISVTLLDGLVLARSAFHHSMNYRSVMLLGRGVTVDDPEEKRTALLATVDHMVAGRSHHARPPSPTEIRATRVVRFPITEGSAKVRTGGPVDDGDDLGLPVWAGEIPIVLGTGRAVPAPDLADGTATPDYVEAYPDRSPAGDGT